MLISPENWNQTALLEFMDMASKTRVCFLKMNIYEINVVSKYNLPFLGLYVLQIQGDNCSLPSHCFLTQKTWVTSTT